ncbi:ABC transporter permease [Kribbella sandramycini]|uniref:ABC transporter permease n=1 Tax=Kribbella sandramycini TaxID=60450 RepID=A0A7Y4L5N6_9ACTN|nr:ABC transporter permease [Kribbella sandramycini]MBB6570777.1 ABC-type dipeptide/oligopeptide/nickel transport system permease component [Kribbella sandramycini]NOL43917.1 ABC transporter permease [Kribbella sandramycini]
MLRFTLRRLAELALVFLGVTFAIYAAVFALPGDPIASLGGDRPLAPDVAERIRAVYHLNDPLWSQYLRYLGRLLTGDLGTDFHGRSVAERLATRWPVTIRLALTAWVIQVVVGVGLGLLAGLRKNTWIDRSVLVLTILIASVPVFVLAATAQLVFGVRLALLPIAGISDGWPLSYLLPATTLAVYGLAAVARLTRGSVAETMGSDHVRALWARGLSRRRVIGIHVLRNSSIPVLTFLAVDLGFLLGGAVVTEGIFNLPGVGQLLFQSIRSHEGPTVVGIATALIIVFLLSSALVDLLNSLLDPRIRHD